jgi:2-polyprenyl-6-methoxyphenol hydroxylase-like FAD-dependent oxidoreductase
MSGRMSLRGRHVVVVGAGIGGAATALLCARAGARVTLFERRADPRAVGGGLVLQPNGLAVLYGLDLDERLGRRGRPLSRLRIADAAERPLLDVAVPRFAAGLDHALAVQRGELLAALIDLVAAEPAVDCRFGIHVLEASPAGSVTHRENDGTRTCIGDLVVVADGAHSALRPRDELPARVRAGRRYARGLGRAQVAPGMTEYWTRLGVFGIAPVDHATYFYASTHAGPVAAAVARRDLPAFRAAWARVLPQAGAVLDGVRGFDELDVDDVVRVDCPRWATRRLVLLGDAAHAMAPNLGQGGSSALTDAAVLVWELGQTDDLPAALARYAARRRPAVRAVQTVASWLGALSHVTHPLLRRLRDGAVRRFGGALLGDLGMRFMEQEDPLFLRLAAADPGGNAEPLSA